MASNAMTETSCSQAFAAFPHRWRMAMRQARLAPKLFAATFAVVTGFAASASAQGACEDLAKGLGLPSSAKLVEACKRSGGGRSRSISAPKAVDGGPKLSARRTEISKADRIRFIYSQRPGLPSQRTAIKSGDGALSKARPRAIYIEDDREDFYSPSAGAHPLQDRLKAAVRATVALVKSSDLSPEGEGVRLATMPFTYWDQDAQAELPMCEGEAFVDQPVGSFCSGVLIAPDIVATAGHCIDWRHVDENDPTLSDVAIVFGFDNVETGARTLFPAENVYYPLRLHERRFAQDDSGEWEDFAIVQLDRPVPASVAQPIRPRLPSAEAVKRETRLGLIGHPSGLPKKVAFSGRSRAVDITLGKNFVAQLNAFGGNSGSPVLLYDDPAALVGLLIRGQGDYALNATHACGRAVVYSGEELCGNGLCGETVLRADLFADFVP